ncbi:SMI1/KNR4 family protein [Streptomyces sp. NPDC059816]|uniref:SMI1/KNR4 family protein n=1 Tax=Streptomyces sp. NPDC059816 TaxID=3346960 RepID=UPI00365C5E9B
MTDSTRFDWRPFLLKWSGEWADCPRDNETRSEQDAAAERARWLGFPPASEERIVAMEARLGRRMPPSYREFLKVSDGWQHAGGFVWLLAGTAEARWHDDAYGLADMFEEHVDEDAEPEERRGAEVWRHGLQLDVESDATRLVMDPDGVGEDGEWAVYSWASWRAKPPRRYPSFSAFMQDMHREFHSLRAGPHHEGPVFVNDTTREQDALVDEARLEALRGGWGRAQELLDGAKGYGRPRAAGLGDQIRRLLGHREASFEGLVTDPRYAPELLPVLLVGRSAYPYKDDSTLRFALRGADEGVVALARATAELVRNGGYRYAPAGPFGEAVERARELARWGDTDEAWQTLREALPWWEPLGPDHLAPLGWVADPVLGPLLTSERGRELLSTPRGGQGGGVPEPTAGLDPGGLAWLADSGSFASRTSYRFVLVEGVEPAELPGRLADGAGAALGRPRSFWETRQSAPRNRREFPYEDDEACVAVGRAGTGWSFAFDGAPARFDRDQFVSPAPAASTGTRAVVVWCGLRAGVQGAFFHLSVARDGAEQYAFTYGDGEVLTSGEVPWALDPSRFFGGLGDGSEVERSLLEAVAEEFGARLPRHAIEAGRLHTFTTRSWTAPEDAGSHPRVRRYWRTARPEDGQPKESEMRRLR